MTATRTRDRRWLILPVILSASFMAILDVFIVNVAAPSLRHELGASAASVQWVVDGYAVAFATALITGGRLGDVIGRRRAFRLGVGAFTLSSALCGAAPSPTALVAARALQGLSCALMMPQVLSIIQVEFEPHERRRCLAMMGGAQGAASVCGQLVGGALISLDGLGLGLALLFYTGLTCVFFLLSIYMQDGLGLGPFASGVAFTPLAVLFVAATLTAPRYFARIGDRLMAIGATVMALAAGAVATGVALTHPSGPTPLLIGGLAILCVGPGVVGPRVINALLRSVPPGAAGA